MSREEVPVAVDRFLQVRGCKMMKKRKVGSVKNDLEPKVSPWTGKMPIKSADADEIRRREVAYRKVGLNKYMISSV